MRWMLSSKIHKATVTEADVNYTGSIGIDETLIEKAGFLPGEKVLVTDQTNVSQAVIVIISIAGDVCQSLPVTKCRNGLQKKAVAEIGLAVFFWNDFPNDDPSISSS